MEDSKSGELLDKFYLNCGFSTRALHAGEHIGQPQHASHTGAIYQTSTFVFKDAEQGARIFSGEESGYMYTRLGNPTVKLLEAKINALEGAGVKLKDPSLRVSSLAFSTGMSAIASTLLALLSEGDTLLMGNVIYGATQHLSQNVLLRYGIKTVEVDTADLKLLEKAIYENPKAKVILFETPTNPLLAVTDIPALVRIVKGVNPDIKVLVDNTFATPYLQRPLEMGVDAVLHSTTKYICGHGTVVGGTLTTVCDEIKDKAYTVIKDIGGSPSPFDAWLVNLGLKTLPIRMENTAQMLWRLQDFLKIIHELNAFIILVLAQTPIMNWQNAR